MPATSSSSLTLTLPSEREIRTSRIFDAPRDLVFKAMTDPNLIPRWWGPRGVTTAVDKVEVRPGGAWRFVSRGAGGDQDAFRGVFREIVPPERIVQTFEWEGLPGHISVDTSVFEEIDGKTRLTTTSLFDSVEDRDGMLKAGMETGLRETLDRFAELLLELRGSGTKTA